MTKKKQYVARAVNLFVKDGGFTKDPKQAKRFDSVAQLRKACGPYWTAVLVNGKGDK